MLIRNLLLIVGVSAIVLGILIAGFLWLRPTAVERPGAPASVNRTEILVAARPIAAGELLRDEDMSWRQIGGPTPPAGSFKRDQISRPLLIGAVTRADLAQGEIITEGAVIRKTDQKFLAAVLSPGLRAVTIDVDASQSAAGLILPDDRVDAILVQHADGGAPGGGASARSVAVLLLQDIRVIAVDRLIDRPPTPAATADGKTPSAAAAATAESPPKTMTLEVTERDAQRLLLAAQIGKVDLALRSLARAREPLVAGAWGLDSAVYASDVSPLRAPPSLMSAAAFDAPAPGTASPSAAPASPPPIPRGLAPIRILRGAKDGP